eukprot:9401092-Alexandrium_andersonii.AAC.1
MSSPPMEAGGGRPPLAAGQGLQGGQDPVAASRRPRGKDKSATATAKAKAAAKAGAAQGALSSCGSK